MTYYDEKLTLLSSPSIRQPVRLPHFYAPPKNQRAVSSYRENTIIGFFCINPRIKRTAINSLPVPYIREIIQKLSVVVMRIILYSCALSVVFQNKRYTFCNGRFSKLNLIGGAWRNRFDPKPTITFCFTKTLRFRKKKKNNK